MRGRASKRFWRARNACANTLVAVLLLPAVGAAAQAPAPADAGDDASRPTTGHAWIDERMIDIGQYAARHREAFVDEIVRYRQAPRGMIEEALDGGGIPPADVYYACLLAQGTGRPCRTILEARRRQPEAGWQALTEQLGIEVDAAMARRFRDDIAASYERWARPLAPVPSRAK